MHYFHNTPLYQLVWRNPVSKAYTEYAKKAIAAGKFLVSPISGLPRFSSNAKGTWADTS